MFTRSNKRKSLFTATAQIGGLSIEPSTGRAGSASTDGAFSEPLHGVCPDTGNKPTSTACGADGGSTALHRVDPLLTARRAEHVFGHSEELAELFDTNPSPVTAAIHIPSFLSVTGSCTCHVCGWSNWIA